MSKKTTLKRNKIKKRIRKIVFGTKDQPRLTVFRSNKEIYAQIIDDSSSKTIASASSKDKDLKLKTSNKTIKICDLVDFKVSKSELGALFRNPDHDKYMECGDQILRNFLNGLVIHLRGPLPKKVKKD